MNPRAGHRPGTRHIPLSGGDLGMERTGSIFGSGMTSLDSRAHPPGTGVHHHGGAAVRGAPRSPARSASVPDCADMLAALANAGCASSSCHASTTPRMGLALDSIEGLKATAIDHVAHQTQTGTEITQTVVSGGRFGTHGKSTRLALGSSSLVRCRLTKSGIPTGFRCSSS